MNPRRAEILRENIALYKQRAEKPEFKKDAQKLKYEIAMMEKELAEMVARAKGMMGMG